MSAVILAKDSDASISCQFANIYAANTCTDDVLLTLHNLSHFTSKSTFIKLKYLDTIYKKVKYTYYQCIIVNEYEYIGYYPR